MSVRSAVSLRPIVSTSLEKCLPSSFTLSNISSSLTSDLVFSRESCCSFFSDLREKPSAIPLLYHNLYSHNHRVLFRTLPLPDPVCSPDRHGVSETHALKQETGPNDGSRRPITAMQGEDFCNPVIFHLCIFAEVSGCLCSTPSPFHPVFCLCRGCQLLDFLFRRFFCLLNTLRIVRIIFKFPNMCIRVVP